MVSMLKNMFEMLYMIISQPNISLYQWSTMQFQKHRRKFHGFYVQVTSGIWVLDNWYYSLGSMVIRGINPCIS